MNNKYQGCPAIMSDGRAFTNYTMNVDEAVRAVNAIKPEIVVPIHYNVVDGTEANPEEFKEKVGSAAKVEIFYR